MLALICVFCHCLQITQAQQVILNQNAPVDSLTQSELRSIFAMRMTHWPNGERIRVMVFEDTNPTHRNFSKNILGIFPYRLRRIWDRLVYSGTGVAPEQVRDEAEMILRIRSTPGAIGYIPESMPGEGYMLVPINED